MVFFNKKKMKIDSDKLVVFLFKAFSYLPNWFLYLLADLGYFVLLKVIKYRKKVVYTNLRNSFPEKTNDEIDRIIRKFYHHIADLVVEGLMMYRLAFEEFDKRLSVKGLDICEKYFKQGKSIILLGMHYANWEWNATIQRMSSHQLLMIYNPVRKNKGLEKLILDMRERFGGLSVPVNQSARKAIEFSNTKRPGALWLAADQTPDRTAKYWTTFLNQETPFFSGPEKIAIKTNQPIIFVETRKLGRGKYESTFSCLFENPANETPENILLTYIGKMEEIITKEPEYWLWSHRRWKHTRPGEIGLIERNSVKNNTHQTNSRVHHPDIE